MANTKQYFCLEPAHFRLDGGAMFGIIPKPMWEKVHPADDKNRINLALRLQVIKTDDKLIIIDTGIGDYNGEKFDARFDIRSDKSPLSQALAKIGSSTNDVTDLVLSHLHFDHIGGIGEVIDGQMTPVFKNATCHVHKDHYEYAHAPSERDSGSFHCKNFDPILNYYNDKGKLTFHSGDEGTIIALESGDIKFKCSHGHTPWLMHPYDESYMYMADLIPTSNHVHIPWVMAYDINPAVSTQEKRVFLDFIVNNKLIPIYEHDPIFWGSEIEKTDKGFLPVNKFKAPKELAYTIS